MRRKAKVDANQAPIVKALRKIPGVTVDVTSAVGEGFPDIVVGYQGRNVLLELKDESKPPSARKLTPAQEKWHREWTGQRAVVKSLDEAKAAIGLEMNR